MTCHWLCPRCTEIRDTERPRGCANATCPSPAEVMTIADPAPAIRYRGGALRFLRDLLVFGLLMVGAAASGLVLVTAIELGTGGKASLLEAWPK